MYQLKLNSVLVAIGFSLTLAGTAHAITVTGAKIDKGAVQVKGKGAAPNATITWEGQGVGQASRGGGFKFSTTILPSDCIGEVGDGVSTASAVISTCGPVATSLVVRDASDSVVGPVIETFPANTLNPPPAVRVAHIVGNTALLLILTRVGTYPNGPVYYESTDCSGPALIPMTAQPNLSIAILPWIGIGRTVYYSVGVPSLRILRSSKAATSSDDDLGSCSTATSQREVSETATLTLAPPFRVELH